MAAAVRPVAFGGGGGGGGGAMAVLQTRRSGFAFVTGCPHRAHLPLASTRFGQFSLRQPVAAQWGHSMSLDAQFILSCYRPFVGEALRTGAMWRGAAAEAAAGTD